MDFPLKEIRGEGRKIAALLKVAEGCRADYSAVMILERFPNLQQLSPSEKLILVSELWNELESNPVSVPVSEEVIAELDRRIEHFEKNPQEFTTWEAVKKRLLDSKA